MSYFSSINEIFSQIIQKKLERRQFLKSMLDNLHFYYQKNDSKYRQKRKEIIKEIFKIDKEIKKWKRIFKI